MKIELSYREEGTKINGFIFSQVYDASEIQEARCELEAARRAGYEITVWRLVHDEDVTLG